MRFDEEPQEFELDFGEVTQQGGGGGAVNSVNGKIGDVVLDAHDVGAATPKQVEDAVADEAESRIAADSAFSDRLDITDSSVAELSNAVASKAEQSSIDKVFLKDFAIDNTPSTTTITFNKAKENILSGSQTTASATMPVASTTQAGVMNSATFQAVQSNADNINALLAGSVAISGLAAEPTQADLTAAWKTATGLTTLINTARIFDTDHSKIWTYFTNTTTWYAVGAGEVTVSLWTNSAPGIAQGSTIDGQVFAESDGTGSVNGWDTLTNQVSDNSENITELQGAVSNIPNVVQSLGTSTTDVVSQNATTNTLFYNYGQSGQSVRIGNTGNIQSNSVTIGKASDSGVTGGSIVVGGTNAASYNGYSSGIVLGDGAHGHVRGGIAIGTQACSGDGRESQNSKWYNIAIGPSSHARESGSIALGSHSDATHVGEMNIGTSSTSYGYNNTNYRLISGVHDGVADHDAATVGQMNTGLATKQDTATVETWIFTLDDDTTVTRNVLLQPGA